MSKRATCGQFAGLVLMALVAAAAAALFSAATPTTEQTRPILGGSSLDDSQGPAMDCPDLITPNVVGPAEFERLRIGEMLRESQFLRHEVQGYIVCVLGNAENERLSSWMYADIYYMFDKETSELAVTRTTWEAESLEPAPTPTPPGDSWLGHGPDTVTVCMDLETPILEVGDANPEQWSILDIVGGGGRCYSSMASQICFDCGADRPLRALVPIVPDQEIDSGLGEPPRSEWVCIDARTAIVLSDSKAVAQSSEGLDTGQCNVSFGHGGLCWYCSPSRAEAAPSPPALTVEGEATPARPEEVELACSDFMTAETIGQEEWERYDIAEKLRSHRFSRSQYSDSECIICSADRMIDEARVDGDKLYYRFDVGSGELLMKRIHWREDLPGQLPSPLISQKEAEALVDDVVEHSRLAFLPPNGIFCEPGTVDYQSPNWLVYGTTGGEMSVHMVTVIDAVTGEVGCRFCPC